MSYRISGNPYLIDFPTRRPCQQNEMLIVEISFLIIRYFNLTT